MRPADQPCFSLSTAGNALMHRAPTPCVADTRGGQAAGKRRGGYARRLYAAEEVAGAGRAEAGLDPLGGAAAGQVGGEPAGGGDAPLGRGAVCNYDRALEPDQGRAAVGLGVEPVLELA